MKTTGCRTKLLRGCETPLIYWALYTNIADPQWPRGLRRRCAAARLLGSRFRIPPGAWIFFYCECLCCQVEVSAKGRSLVQRSPADCGVCLSVIK
jgi:hypothetical protein